MSKIEWTNITWNPVTGCDKISQGCKHCYAETMHRRLMAMFPDKYSKPFLGGVQLHPEELQKPLKWSGCKMVFVNSMSDLFHHEVPFEFILQVFIVMMSNPWHIFQILTKRASRLPDFFRWWRGYDECSFANYINRISKVGNIWIGVSAEDQKTFDERFPHLLDCPAALRFVSCEPLLGRIDMKIKGIADLWIIAGGESGAKARPMHPAWIRSIRDQCKEADTPFFFKQWGEWIDNQNMSREHVAGNYKQNVLGSGYFSVEVWKVGKKKAGNTLDGKQHLQFPELALKHSKSPGVLPV